MRVLEDVGDELRRWRRWPFEWIDRRWRTDAPWRGECRRWWGWTVRVLRVWCYEGCYGCPPDSLVFILSVQLLIWWRRWKTRRAGPRS